MSDFVWTKSYPKTVPQEINPDAYGNLADFFDKNCRKFAHRPAYHNMGKEISFTDLDRLATYFAAYLQSLGLQKGDRIAIQMPNLLQYPVCMFGAIKAGLVVVNTNPLYTEREMEHQFRDAGVRAVVIVTNFCEKLERVLKSYPIEHVITTSVGDMLGFPKNLVVNFALRYVKKMVPKFEIPQSVSLSKALLKGAFLPFKKPELRSEDLCFLQYTGGTTGVSKGAMLTHRNILANVAQMTAWVAPVLTETEEIIVTPLPLYHIFSLTVNCITFINLGSKNVLITNPRDIPAFIKELKQHKFTTLTGVNTLFNALLHSPSLSDVDFSSLKLVVGGGMAVQKAVAQKWKAATGVPLVEGYGLTEASPVLSASRVDGYEREGTIGIPLPSTEIRIQSEEGKVLSVGEAGELCARGPQVMKGYWQRPEATAEVLSAEGWLKTGDIATMDNDGYFRIVDRKKDMIIVSGFNVYPNEIEDVIAQHPGVLEVAAIGVEDEHSGEAVKIFVVKKNESLTIQTLKDFAREKLTGYKVPKYVEFRDELPKTNVGKILRRALKEEAGSHG